MTIGILKLDLFIQGSSSLKEKRMVLRSLKARLRNSFNVAVTEIDEGDKWQRAVLAVVGVDRDKRNLNSILSKVINFVERFGEVGLINHEMELI